MMERFQWELEALKECVKENRKEAQEASAKIHSDLEKKIDLLKADVTKDIDKLRGESTEQFKELKNITENIEKIVSEAKGFSKATKIGGSIAAFAISCLLAYAKLTGKM